MDFNPAGTLFATCDRADQIGTPVLITVDPVTGAGTEVAPLVIDDQFYTVVSAVPDISIGSDGILYAYLTLVNSVEQVSANFLGMIDSQTGVVTLIGMTGTSGSGNGVAFSPDDMVLFHADDISLDSLD